MKTLFLISLLSFFLHAQDNLKKVVFDLTSGSIEVFEKKVLSGIALHKSYYEGKLEELQVAVVVHGDAYKFFLKDISASQYKNDAELVKKNVSLSKRINSLSDIYEVEFLMCESGVNKHKINKNNIYDNVKLVRTSTVGLIDKQIDGYAYVPIFK